MDGGSSRQRSTRSLPGADGSQPAGYPPMTPPLCACGCGMPTRWNPRRKRWGAYLFRHGKSSTVSRYSQRVKQLRRVTTHPSPPPCRCGCGKPVLVHKHGAGQFWADFIRTHQNRGRSTMSVKQRASQAARMRISNPMRRPEVAAKVAKSLRGQPLRLSESTKTKMAQAARARMLSDANPMRNPEISAAVMSRLLGRVRSKSEAQFEQWAIENNVTLAPTGDGRFWIGRRNPDFRVPQQRKVIEVTEAQCFVGGRRPRTLTGYALPTIAHYASKGWLTLVVYKRDYRCMIPAALLPVLRSFVSPESNWSGVWHFDRLLQSAT